MGEIMTMKEIEKRFDKEWVLLEDPKCAKDLSITGGTLLLHHKNRELLYKKAKKLTLKRFAVFYVGDPPKDVVFLL